MMALMFESRTEPLAPRHIFFRRAVKFFGLAFVVIGVALAIGVLGYHFIAEFGWIDSLLNASMILGGMGPVGELPSDEAISAACVLQTEAGRWARSHGGNGDLKLPFGAVVWPGEVPLPGPNFPDNLRLRPGYAFGPDAGKVKKS